MRLELFHTRKQLIMAIYTSLTRVMSLWFLQEMVSSFVIQLCITVITSADLATGRISWSVALNTGIGSVCVSRKWKWPAPLEGIQPT